MSTSKKDKEGKKAAKKAGKKAGRKADEMSTAAAAASHEDLSTDGPEAKTPPEEAASEYSAASLEKKRRRKRIRRMLTPGIKRIRLWDCNSKNVTSGTSLLEISWTSISSALVYGYPIIRHRQSAVQSGSGCRSMKN